MTERCLRRTIASGDFVIVEQCSCGSVHVTIGAVTLRLAASALPPLAATLAEAARSQVLRRALSPVAVADGVAS